VFRTPPPIKLYHLKSFVSEWLSILKAEEETPRADIRLLPGAKVDGRAARLVEMSFPNNHPLQCQTEAA
jgi:hypothetical protein